jgi:hypothetical protein
MWSTKLCPDLIGIKLVKSSCPLPGSRPVSSLQSRLIRSLNELRLVNYGEFQDYLRSTHAKLHIVHAQTVDSVPGKDFQMNRSNPSVVEWAAGNHEGGSVSCVNVHTPYSILEYASYPFRGYVRTTLATV